MTAGTNGVLSLEQKMKILIQPKKAKVGAIHIAYSAKRTGKIQVMEKASVAFIESNREINIGESTILFIVGTLNTNYGPKKTLFTIPSAE